MLQYISGVCMCAYAAMPPICSVVREFVCVVYECVYVSATCPRGSPSSGKRAQRGATHIHSHTQMHTHSTDTHTHRHREFSTKAIRARTRKDMGRWLNANMFFCTYRHIHTHVYVKHKCEYGTPKGARGRTRLCSFQCVCVCSACTCVRFVDADAKKDLPWW